MIDSQPECCGYVSKYSEAEGGHSACCYRETWRDHDRCIWHAVPKKGESKPIDDFQEQNSLNDCAPRLRRDSEMRYLNRGDVKTVPTEILDGARLSTVQFADTHSFHGCMLRNADFSGADLTGANLSGANLLGADLSGANLSEAVLSEGEPWRTDFSGADLSGADLSRAEFLGAVLNGTDLSGADLSGAFLWGADLRNANLSDTLFTQATTFGPQVAAEQDSPSPTEWDKIARAYHAVKTRLSDQGLVGKARRQYLLERRARRLEAKADGEYLTYVLSLGSRVLAGYGVDLKAVVIVMLLIFVIPTAVYWYVDMNDFIYYSAVTFTDTPPLDTPPDDSMIELVTLIQMFLGTLSIVLLGYVLGARESI